MEKWEHAESVRYLLYPISSAPGWKIRNLNPDRHGGNLLYRVVRNPGLPHSRRSNRTRRKIWIDLAYGGEQS